MEAIMENTAILMEVIKELLIMKGQWRQLSLLYNLEKKIFFVRSNLRAVQALTLPFASLQLSALLLPIFFKYITGQCLNFHIMYNRCLEVRSFHDLFQGTVFGFKLVCLCFMLFLGCFL